MCGECSNILHLGLWSSLIHPRNVCNTSQGSTPFILGKYSIHPRKVSGSSLACIRFIPGLDSDVLLQVQAMGDACGKLLFVVAHHDERLARTTTEGVDNLLHQLAIAGIEAMQRLVEDEQLGVFDKGTCQQAKTLLTTGKGKKIAVAQMSNAKHIHPPFAHGQLLGMSATIKPDRIVKTRCDNVNGRQILQVSTMHLGRDVTDVFLDFPNAFTRTPTTVEKCDVARVRLWIVGTYKTQQSGLSCAIFTRQGPSFTIQHRPVKCVQYGAFAIADRDLTKLDDTLSIYVVCTTGKSKKALSLLPIQCPNGMERLLFLIFGK